MLLLNEVDSASSETAPGHAAPAESGQAFSGVDHDIEFTATDFIQIAQADVGLVHEYFHSAKIACRQSLCGIKRPLIFKDHVGATFQDGRRKTSGVLIEQFDRDIAERVNIREGEKLAETVAEVKESVETIMGRVEAVETKVAVAAGV